MINIRLRVIPSQLERIALKWAKEASNSIPRHLLNFWRAILFLNNWILDETRKSFTTSLALASRQLTLRRETLIHICLKLPGRIRSLRWLWPQLQCVSLSHISLTSQVLGKQMLIWTRFQKALFLTRSTSTSGARRLLRGSSIPMGLTRPSMLVWKSRSRNDIRNLLSNKFNN